MLYFYCKIMITNFLILFKKSPLLALLNSKRLEISPKNGWRANGFISQLAVYCTTFEPILAEI